MDGPRAIATNQAEKNEKIHPTVVLVFLGGPERNLPGLRMPDPLINFMVRK